MSAYIYAYRQLILVLLLCIGSVSVAWSADKDRTITIAVNTDATIFDPHLATDKPTVSLNENMYEGLLSRDDNGEFHPKLAKSWELKDDRVTWVFNIRDDVYFTDGEKLDANAVKINLERILSPETGAAGRGRLIGIKDVEAPDANTLEIVTEYPWPDLLDGLAGPTTRMISPAALNDDAELVKRHPVGTGPFMLDEHKTGDHTTLSRNPNYWGDEPWAEKILVKFIPDASGRYNLIRSGAADIALNINPEDLEDLKREDSVDVVVEPSTFIVFYIFDIEKEPLRDVRVREALNIAIDRDAIVKSILKSSGISNSNFFVGPMAYVDKRQSSYEYNPERAKELLKEAGYSDSLELTLWTVDRYVKDTRIAEAVQAYLAQVGVKLNIEVMDWGTHWQKINNNKSRDADMWLLGTSIDDPTYRLMWNFGPTSGDYTGGYVTEEWAQLINDISRETDQVTREELFANIRGKIKSEYPYLFLYQRTVSYVKRSSIHGFKISGREIWEASEVTRDNNE